MVCRSSRHLTLVTGSISRTGGGVVDVVRSLSQTIRIESRYSVSVLGLRDAEEDLDRASWGSIEPEAFGVYGPKGFGYAPGLAKALVATNPDVVHVHGLWMYPSVAAIRWSRGTKPYIVSPHGMLDAWALNNSREKKRVCAILYENRHLRDAACIHALNRAEAAAIRGYGLTNPICVIPNGVELPTDQGVRRVKPIRRLLYLGRLHAKKGLSRLIEAWSIVNTKGSSAEWRLTIAGWDQNGHRRELEMLAARNLVSANIDFIGPQFDEDKASCFREASAFILPSVSEGLPMTVLEAWSYRLPVLMTPHCNLPEGPSVGAAITMEASADSIAQALCLLINMSDADRELMGRNGRKLVEERFAWPRIGIQMADVYDWVVGLGEQPDCVMLQE